jgi:hypothetical protein
VAIPVGPQLLTENDANYLMRQQQSAVGFVLFVAPDGEPMLGESDGMFLDGVALAIQLVDPLLVGCELVGYVDESTLPVKPHFQGPPRKLCREAWRWVGGAVVVDLPSARTTKMRGVRDERNRRLVEADGDKVRLDDTGTPAQIAAHRAYRQALRDLPAAAAAELDGTATALEVDGYQAPWPVQPAG